MKNYLFLIFLISCASTPSNKDKAEKLSENGLCKDAISFWEKAVADDANDMDAKIGLNKCYEKLILDELVVVRNLRSSNQEIEATTLMFKIKANIMNWKVNLDYNSSSFQAKEIENLWFFWKTKIDEALAKNQALKASFIMSQNYFLFGTLGDYSEKNAEVQKNGLVLCQNLLKNSTEKPYLSEFSQKVCGFYESKESVISNIKVDKERYQNVYVDLDITGMGSISRNELQSVLNNAFRSSPWFYANAESTLYVKSSGNLSINLNRFPEKREKVYSVEIPYFEKVAVSKTRQVPYYDTVLNCNTFGSNICTSQYVQKYRTEYYTVYETVKKYRDEERVLSYTGAKDVQDINLVVNSTYKTKKDEIFNFNQKFYEEKFSHDVSDKESGLSPEYNPLTPTNTALNSLFVNYSNTFLNSLNNSWVDLYCQSGPGTDFYTEANQVMKCQKSPLYNKNFVEAWSMNHMGLGFDKLKKMLSF